MTLIGKQNNRKENSEIKARDYLQLLIVPIIVIFIFRTQLIYDPMLNYFNVNKVKGVIFNEKNYERRGHLTNRFSYSYKFYYKGEQYTNESNNQDLKVGDSIDIIFISFFPSINKIVE
ncbi:hypothetical protein [Flavobacterium sp.]|uniref:hypothetical protein n=1 Tax=Flavobacterium sp. TaxID=239 RepID=UPI002631CA62|nr:hypothetical protein [Flavobacterium sp.]